MGVEKREGILNLQNIVAELTRERDRLNRAIAELERAEPDVSFSRKKATPASSDRGDQHGRQMTAEGRKRLSEAMKKRWAERRKKRA